MRQAFIFSCFCLLFFSGYAQNSTSFQNLVNVGTVSPEAASLGKFGNIPVSYSTGVPNITIPVFEINIGKIKMPLSLDYHAGGIRVDEVSSMVGIGWALNGIGMISRSVIGLPDDGSGGYTYAYSFDSVYNYQISARSYGTDPDTRFGTYIQDVGSGVKDEDPDVFSYSLSGQSGKFIHRQNGAIMQIPHSNNTITPINANYQITDENGTVYIFDQQEHTVNVSGATTPTYISTWRLSKMIDANTADTIYFNYESACTINTEKFTNYSYTFTDASGCNVNPSGETYVTNTISHNDELFLKEILWRGGKISFINTCDRTDKASEKRLNEVDVYANLKGALQLVKKVKLYQSYFYNNQALGYAPSDERNYRMRLDSVGYFPIDSSGTPPEMYRITYNTSKPLASRESMVQDTWGFNNGQFSNTTLMPRQLVVFEGAYYNIGESVRDPDSLSMLAGTITSIQYPTGGKTVFELEPHQYATNLTYNVAHSLSTSATGNVQSSSQLTFQTDSNSTGYFVTYSFSSYNYPDVSARPNITITDQTTGQQISFISSSTDPTQSINNYSTPIHFPTVLGHSYLVVVNIYTTTDAQVNAVVNISWTDAYTNIQATALGGGLRVKTISNYDYNGNFINRQSYKYGIGDNGLGQLLTDASYLQINSEMVYFWCGSSGFCAFPGGGRPIYLSAVYHANGVYPATQFSGSPVVYNTVSKYEVDSAGNNKKGKSVYTYHVYDDQPAFATTAYTTVGVWLVSNAWKNGMLAEQDDYTYNPSNAQYTLLHQLINNYQPSRPDTMLGLKMKTQAIHTAGCYTYPDTIFARSGFTSYRIPTLSGAMLLQSTTDILWDNAGHPVSNQTSYAYADTTHLFLTSKQMTNSKGNLLVENYKYPHDLSATGNVYQKMLTRNIIAPVVQTQNLNTGVQTSLTDANYQDWFGNNTLLTTANIDHQEAANPIEIRILFNQFDRYGNILQQQKVTDAYQCYIWDYDSTYPIAKVTNAAVTDVAFTSFEADGRGNWSFLGTPVADPSSPTGVYSYPLSGGAISKAGLTSTQTYIVSYWSKTGASYTVTGSTGVIKGKTIGAWTYFEHTVTGVSTVTVSSGSGNIDELRLYPKTAQMTTYAYRPLIGMSSQCDANNLVTYYTYDGLGRLKVIKDQDGNILKTLDYHYIGN